MIKRSGYKALSKEELEKAYERRRLLETWMFFSDLVKGAEREWNRVS